MSELAAVFSEDSPEMVESAETETLEAVEAEAEPATEEVEAEVTTTPEQVEEVETETAEPEESMSAQDKALLAQAKDERRKRQELQKRLEELEAKTAEAEQKTPDVFEDQEAFVQNLKQDAQNQIYKAKVDLSREMMMGFYDDYESVESVFLEEAEKNPILKAEAAQAPNLAKFAYEQGKKIEAHREMQDVEGYKAKLRAEIEAELKAEAEIQQAEKAKKAATLSPSLASARGSSVSEKPKDTLADMFND